MPATKEVQWGLPQLSGLAELDVSLHYCILFCGMLELCLRHALLLHQHRSPICVRVYSQVLLTFAGRQSVSGKILHNCTLCCAESDVYNCQNAETALQSSLNVHIAQQQIYTWLSMHWQQQVSRSGAKDGMNA